MTPFDALLFVHVLGASVLLGTGAGIAFFMVVANRSRDAGLIAYVSGIVVLADTVFTAPAMVLQPLTGFFLARESGWPVFEGWIAVSLVLWLVVGALWLPVVWMQLRMRDLARAARDAGRPLPATYHRLFRWWFAFGFPALGAVLAIFWLMLTKPSF